MTETIVTRDKRVTDETTWVARAEAALAGGGTNGRGADGRGADGRGNDESITLVRGQRPPVLDGEGSDALIAPWIAGFLWAAAIFRETQSGYGDPVALALRWLALGLSVRAARLLWRLLLRLKLWLDATRYQLAITDDGLLLRTPTFDLPLARADVLDVREEGDWRTRSGRRFHNVYVTTRPTTGRLMVTLPPVLDETPGLLAERLMRWLGPPPTESPSFAEPDPLPSKLYESVSSGEARDGVIALPHGQRWIERGPFFTVLLGLVLLERWLQLEQELRVKLGLAPLGLIVACVLVIPLTWWWNTRRMLSPRRGLSLVFTRAELLMRTGSGIHRVPWRSLKRVSVESRRSWSLLSGNQQQRGLLIERLNDPEIRYDEVFLGLPTEAVAGLIEAYRRGRLP